MAVAASKFINMELLDLLLVLCIGVIAHLLLNADDDEGGKFSRQYSGV